MLNSSPAIYKRRNPKRRAPPDAPPREGPVVRHHGECVGEVVFRLHGQEVTARLLATGHHCRSYGVEIGGQVVGVMGADKAWGEVSKRVGRLPSPRSDVWT